MRAKHIICWNLKAQKYFVKTHVHYWKRKNFSKIIQFFFLCNAKVHIILKSRNEGAKSTSIGARTGFLGSSHFLLRKENSSFTRKTTFGVLPKTIIFFVDFKHISATYTTIKLPNHSFTSSTNISCKICYVFYYLGNIYKKSTRQIQIRKFFNKWVNGSVANRLANFYKNVFVVLPSQPHEYQS